MLLHIDVVNKVATYQKRDGCIVCGNSGYKIEFNLDSEWDYVQNVLAVFIVNGQVVAKTLLESNECDVPIIKNTDKVVVGIYSETAGMATTATEIPCKKSILCT